ncbi:hypothetical protein SEUBUCD646_0E02030 [Saccharomyces eubayanus]|uniref:SUMO-targeted ubiquitin ligase complex subunit slx8 n=2 Tax=Saccharomyces TaxID=4930 RepID=A0A6C1E7X7_SACPS|nr:SUMO-targeted ubiquitin ligase complex subunit slx8 [Saccharomyces pastorianus]CAI1959140.1 hypothetical protein SEUBUCD650_0E02070 [Saccharomyces eubayanus]CAI1988062.1 hypothetical protein SEUBUCD646_0E02030 [Saccharomyces eubayanus]
MTSGPDNQGLEDENLRIKRARIEPIEHNGDEDESCLSSIDNGVAENREEDSEAAVEVVGERFFDNVSEDDDTSLFRALEEGSGNSTASAAPNITTRNDGRTADNGGSDANGNNAATTHDGEAHTVEVPSQTADPSSASLISQEIPPLIESATNIKGRTVDLTAEAIDLDAEEQQVLEISDKDFQDENKTPPKEYGAAKDYRCPICFDPPETALMTLCGHVFCCSCLFQMVNSSRTCRQFGHCALCRSKVYLKDVRMIILRKKQVKKKAKS